MTRIRRRAERPTPSAGVAQGPVPALRREPRLEVSPLSRLEPAAAAAAARLLSAVRSKETARAYQAAEAYWKAWYRARFGAELAIPVEAPLPVERVVQFVLDHVHVPGGKGHQPMLPSQIDEALVAQGVKASPGPLSLATVRHRISVMSRLHASFGPNNPCRSFFVIQLLRGVGALQAEEGVARRTAPAMKRADLECLLGTCDASLAGLRDRALLLFAWESGGRRRGEAVRATVENTVRQRDGTYLFTMLRSKTNAQGMKGPEVFPVEGGAAAALDEWIARSDIRSGPLFCRIRSGNHIAWASLDHGRAVGLTDTSFNAIVKKRARAAGLKEKFSAHSLRSGFVTQAMLDGMPIDRAMAKTGHTSVQVFLHYKRTAGAAGMRQGEEPGEPQS